LESGIFVEDRSGITSGKINNIGLSGRTGKSFLGLATEFLLITLFGNLVDKVDDILIDKSLQCYSKINLELFS